MTTSPPILIIGAGLAGFVSALEASTHTSDPIFIFEKWSKSGGNSAKASSGINGVNTLTQHKHDVHDSVSLFHDDTIKSGKGDADEDLVKLLVENSTKAIGFLEFLGVDLSELSLCGGHSVPRTHRQNDPVSSVGYTIMKKLNDAISQKKNIRIFYKHNVTELIQLNGEIVGIRYEKENDHVTRDLMTKSVIIASGGYSCNETLINKYARNLSHLPTTNGAWTTGDGIFLAERVGADLVQMDSIQLHPTGFINPIEPLNRSVFLCPEALRGVGSIIVDNNGERFVNELGTRDFVSQEIIRVGKAYRGGFKSAFLIMNEDIEQKFGVHIYSFYKKIGLIQTWKNGKEFCEKEGVDEESLKRTILRWNQHRSDDTIDTFGRSSYPFAFDFEKTIYTSVITPSIHYTMGGIKFDVDAQVIDTSGKKIPRLFAIGEVTGGLHGKNRLAGNSLLECVVFGRIAGKSATK